MSDEEINKLKGEISRRKAELKQCMSFGYSPYNDYLERKIIDMENELSKHNTSPSSGYGAFT